MCVENKIAYYCENNNMTIAGLAQKLKVKERAVLQWEKGVKIPDIDEMRKLSEILNVSIEELFVIEDVKTNAAEKDCYDSIFQKYDYERIWKFKRSTIIASSEELIQMTTTTYSGYKENKNTIYCAPKRFSKLYSQKPP